MFTTKNLIIFIGRQALIAVMVVVPTIIAIVFLSRQIDQISTRTANERQQEEKFERHTGLFSALARDLAIVGTNDRVIEQAFPPTDNILPFTFALEMISSKNNAHESFHFDTPIASTEMTSFPLSIVGYQNSLSLNINSLSSYLKEFERLPYFTKIDGLSFVSSDASGWQTGGTANYRAVLYTKTSK